MIGASYAITGITTHAPRAVVRGPVEPPCSWHQIVRVVHWFVRAQRAGSGDCVVRVRAIRQGAAHASVGRAGELVEPGVAAPVRKIRVRQPIKKSAVTHEHSLSCTRGSSW